MDKLFTPRKSTWSDVPGLLAWLAVTFVAAAAGAVASSNAKNFYLALSRPDWAPPPWVFGPVWSVLYLMMGMAAWLVWRQRSAPGRSRALALFVAQLVANALWSWLFFASHEGAMAFVDVLVLWALVALTAQAFWRIRRRAGVLLLPYLAWVSFASALTWAVWQRNPGVL
ncbi:TspO/MBR family protein [Roseateles sp.]|uniref:TspO/MBR family protein n=1 Tax=Roseateles sp. TaxID=1971397 RepID=UPI003BAA9FCF